jgi:hypothetical protein
MQNLEYYECIEEINYFLHTSTSIQNIKYIVEHLNPTQNRVLFTFYYNNKIVNISSSSENVIVGDSGDRLQWDLFLELP